MSNPSPGRRELEGIPADEWKMPEPQPPGDRFILYSDEKGIFLGEGRWSFVNAEWHNAAITYSEKWADHFVKQLKDKFKIEARKLQVRPDKDFNLISVEALGEQGFPIWEPTEPPEWVRKEEERLRKKKARRS